MGKEAGREPGRMWEGSRASPSPESSQEPGRWGQGWAGPACHARGSWDQAQGTAEVMGGRGQSEELPLVP